MCFFLLFDIYWHYSAKFAHYGTNDDDDICNNMQGGTQMNSFFCVPYIVDDIKAEQSVAKSRQHHRNMEKVTKIKCIVTDYEDNNNRALQSRITNQSLRSIRIQKCLKR